MYHERQVPKRELLFHDRTSASLHTPPIKCAPRSLSILHSSTFRGNIQASRAAEARPNTRLPQDGTGLAHYRRWTVKG